MRKVTAYQIEANALIDELIAELRKLTFADAMSLPEVSGERELTLGGIQSSVTVFAQRDVDNLPGAVLVTVLVARKRLFGAVRFHTDRGLVFSPDGTVRDATDRELLDSGG